MPESSSFEYAIVRVVPRVERGEQINAGVILYCRAREFLAATVELDRARLLALAPEADVALIESHLDSVARICRGGADAGPIGALSQAERFHWLTAPRSTIIQTSPVHSGRSRTPEELLEHLLDTMVRIRIDSR